MSTHRREIKLGLEEGITADQNLFTAGYVPPVKMIHDFRSFPLMVKTLEDSMGELSTKPPNDKLRLILTETLLLNPNVDLSERGRFVVEQQHKGYLLESLVKAVIGNTKGLGPGDFNFVASCFSDGRLFEDGIGFPVDSILTPLITDPGMAVGDRKDDYWSAEREKRPDMVDRTYWWRAEHDLISRHLREFASAAKKGENLEVGAGWGDFYWLAPKWFRENMVSAEWNPMYIAEFKARFHDADVRQGNIYDLKVPDETYRNVLGLTPFVSLWHLDHAVNEMWRVLKPGGRFFSFQDLIPNDDQTVDQLLKRGMVPDPTHVLFFRSEEKRAEVAEALTHVGGEFGGPEWKRYKRVLHANAKVQNLYEYSEQWLMTELKYRGFNILHANDDTEVYIGPREDRHKRLCGRCSMDHNRDIGMFMYGNPRGPFMEPHPVNYTVPYRLLGDDIVERVTVWSVIAEKPTR